MTRAARRTLDGELVFDRYLGSGLELGRLQELLLVLAPRWATELRVRRSTRDQRPIAIADGGALEAAVMAAVNERGSTFDDQISRFGRPPFERVVGSAELRGAGSELIVVISVDATVASRLRQKVSLGNSISLQCRRLSVEGEPAERWMRRAFERLCDGLSPVWAAAGDPDEYRVKVMSDPPVVEAIGRDFGRYLPGLFWLNFFGGRYRELIGDDRLRSAPAPILAEPDSGVLIGLSDDPWGWNTAIYARTESAVGEHLGLVHFFDRLDPRRPWVAPDWSASRGEPPHRAD